jgi:lysozyme
VQPMQSNGSNSEAEEDLVPGIFLDNSDRARSEPRGPFRGIYSVGLELTKRSESFRSFPYNDPANFCTIAYGHLIAYGKCDDPVPLEYRQGITLDYGNSLLIQDLHRAEYAVATLTTGMLSDGQYAALCDFVYNVGAANYESSTLRSKVNSGEWRDVPRQFRRWIIANGKILNGLKARRESEIRVFFDGNANLLKSGASTLSTGKLIDIRTGESNEKE